MGLVATLLFLLAAGHAAAYRRWMMGMPNAGLIPCAGEKSNGCHGTKICEAFGHKGCVVAPGQDADDSIDGGSELKELANDFGALFAGAAKKVR